MKYTVLATDYDGTIAHDGQVPDATVSSLRRAKAAGMQLFMVSGRELDDLLRIFPFAGEFDLLILENGALVYDPSSKQTRPLADPPPQAFLDRLRHLNIPINVGRSIVATVEPHQYEVLQAIHDLGMEWHIIFNKGWVMALPSGVNKGSALTAMLRDRNIPAEQVVALGDAENDITFLQTAGYPVAVANALPSVKAVAKWVTPSPHGQGMVELVDQLLSNRL